MQSEIIDLKDRLEVEMVAKNEEIGSLPLRRVPCHGLTLRRCQTATSDAFTGIRDHIICIRHCSLRLVMFYIILHVVMT